MGSQLYDVENQIKSLIERKTQASDEGKEQLKQIEKERDMLTQCLTVAARAKGARMNDLFKDIVPESESQNLIVSTIGDLISARRISSRSKASRLLDGQISDETLQTLSQNPEIETRSNVEFQHRYGPGYQLHSSLTERKASPDNHCR